MFIIVLNTYLFCSLLKKYYDVEKQVRQAGEEIKQLNYSTEQLGMYFTYLNNRVSEIKNYCNLSDEVIKSLKEY
jgi:hypothetical protein